MTRSSPSFAAQTFYTLSAPSYHPVSSMKVGPIAKISQLGNLSTEIPCLYPNGIESGLCYDAPPTYPGYPKLLLSPGPTFTQSGGLNGVYDLRYRVRPSNAVSSFGKSIPIANVTVYIDNKAVYTQVFPKTIVQYYGSWKLDTKTLSKGAHTVSIQALDVDGTPSWQDCEFLTRPARSSLFNSINSVSFSSSSRRAILDQGCRIPRLLHCRLISLSRCFKIHFPSISFIFILVSFPNKQAKLCYLMCKRHLFLAQ